MINPKIIYEDADVLVIDKPAGLTVHQDGRNQDESLVDWLEKKYPEIKGVGEEEMRSGLVHRLDKDTSGVMIVAKNQNAYEFLKKQFSGREVKKKYLAIVYGNFKGDGGVIDKPIGRSPKDFKLRDASSQARGRLREAVTEFKVLETFPSERHLDDYSLIEVMPKTGRTHQIRVHMKLLSHPILFDHLYAKDRKRSKWIGIYRQALHAESLEIKLPSGIVKTFSASLPEDMATAVDRLRKRV